MQVTPTRMHTHTHAHSHTQIEYWHEARNPLEAYKLIEQMHARSIIISPYLDQRMVDDIYKVCVCVC